VRRLANGHLPHSCQSVSAMQSAPSTCARLRFPGCAVVSGDDFLPIFMYILVHSDLPDASLLHRYIQELADPVLLNGQGGYYLTVFEAAVNDIERWSAETHPEELTRADVEYQVGAALRYTGPCALHATRSQRSLSLCPGYPMLGASSILSVVCEWHPACAVHVMASLWRAMPAPLPY
jgi:hypothetical protein